MSTVISALRVFPIALTMILIALAVLPILPINFPKSFGNSEFEICSDVREVLRGPEVYSVRQP